MNFDGEKKGSLSEWSAVSQWLVCTRLGGDLEMVTSASVWVKLGGTPHGNGERGPTETRAPARRLKDLLVRVRRARPLSPKPLFSQKGDFLFLAWPSPPQILLRETEDRRGEGKCPVTCPHRLLWKKMREEAMLGFASCLLWNTQAGLYTNTGSNK